MKDLYSRFMAWLSRSGVTVGLVGIAFGLVGLGIAVFGGSGTDPEPDDNGADTPTVSVPTTDPDDTGDPDDPDTPDAVPADAVDLVSVKIDNAPAAVPQRGLESARVIVEVPVEGGMTRFVAVYDRDSIDVVGPVRSLRPADTQLLRAFGDVVVATGGQPFVRGAIAGAGIQILDFDAGLLQRTDDLPPYDVVALLGEAAAFGGSPAQVFSPGTDPDTTDSIESFTVDYSSVQVVQWQWDGDTWLRTQNGQPHETRGEADVLTPVSASAVLVLEVETRDAGYTDSNDVPVPTFDTVGAGEMTLYVDGGVVRGTWSRASIEAPFTIVSGGTVVSVPLDSLFIHIVDDTTDVTES